MKYFFYLGFFICTIPTFAQEYKPSKNRLARDKIEQDISNQMFYEQKTKEAHAFFEKKEYEKAKQHYLLVLKVFPEDAFIKAKINDLELMVWLQQNKIKQQKNYDTMAIEKEEKPVEVIPEIVDKATEENKKTTEKLVQPIEKLPETAQKDTVQVKKVEDLELLDKKSVQFQQALAVFYPEGKTEILTNSDKGSIKKVIIVKNGKGNEYIKHIVHYGSFFFKNSYSITEDMYNKETAE